ncbi:MAG: replication initiator protein A [Lachnospiraceae bacterium]|nr:replication initiator protein A [Lachnospiraceae bacterium]
MSDLQFNYYYGREPDQYQFYRIPKLLITDARFKVISSDAKLLYGLMLDRMSLSMKNGWLDDEERVYIIYTIESVCEDMNCSRGKAIKLMAELDEKKVLDLLKRRGADLVNRM